MYHLKRFKKKKDDSDKDPFLIYDPHDSPGPLFPTPEMIAATGRTNCSFYQLTAIDPGIKNCGIRVERRWSVNNQLVQIETVMNVRIDFKTRITALNKGIDLSLTGIGGNANTIYYTESIKMLEKYMPLFAQSQYIIIESQLTLNYELTRFGQHLITYMTIGVRNKGCLPLIIEIDSKFKTKVFDIKSDVDIKKWAVEKAYELFRRNNDAVGIGALDSGKSKKDDLSDVVCYCEAWWIVLCSQSYAGRKCEIRLPQTSFAVMTPASSSSATSSNVSLGVAASSK